MASTSSISQRSRSVTRTRKGLNSHHNIVDIVLGPAGENVSCNCLPTVYRLFTAAKHAWSTVQVGKGTGGFFVFRNAKKIFLHNLFLTCWWSRLPSSPVHRGNSWHCRAPERTEVKSPAAPRRAQLAECSSAVQREADRWSTAATPSGEQLTDDNGAWLKLNDTKNITIHSQRRGGGGGDLVGRWSFKIFNGPMHLKFVINFHFTYKIWAGQICHV